MNWQTVTILDLVRENNSLNGNPAYTVFYESADGYDHARTSSDAGCSYALPNYRNKQVQIHLTKGGRIDMVRGV
jgi:hypothetical protein